jgi:[ribosomal protein S5]-alanine N-acetyltransferase
MAKLTYQTKRLIIRPLKLTDYSVWLRAHQTAEPKRDKFDSAPAPLKMRSYARFRKNIARQRRHAQADLRYVWNIFLKSTGELAGFMDISTISRDPHQMANIGYYIVNIYRGNGYATEALRKLVTGAFKELKFHRFEAVIDLDNYASLKLAKKAGFYREVIKKHYWFQNGRWEDQVAFIAVPEMFK